MFKGAEYHAWYERVGVEKPWEKYERALYEEHSLIHELTTLCMLGPHKNIIPRPQYLVVTGKREQRIIGFLQPVRVEQTIEEQVAFGNEENVRIPLATMAKWCLGMARGILHIHVTCNTFHMDMKPGHILVEDDETPRIIDWQQQGMCRTTHPPEATLSSSRPKIRKIEDHMRLDRFRRPVVTFTPPPRGGNWAEDGLRDTYVT